MQIYSTMNVLPNKFARWSFKSCSNSIEQSWKKIQNFLTSLVF